MCVNMLSSMLQTAMNNAANQNPQGQNSWVRLLSSC
jgi:hypothetical protein